MPQVLEASIVVVYGSPQACLGAYRDAGGVLGVENRLGFEPFFRRLARRLCVQGDGRDDHQHALHCASVHRGLHKKNTSYSVGDHGS